MNFYNIALYPDPAFAKICADFSQRQFSRTAETYLLGPQAHAHVTLCQFQAKPEQIDPLWQQVRTAMAPIFLVAFNLMYFLQGTGPYENHIWTGLSAKRDATLIEAQSKLIRILAQHKIESLTDEGDAYFPHLTFALLRKPSPHFPLTMQNLEWPAELVRNWPICFELTLGASDINGIYRQKLLGIES